MREEEKKTLPLRRRQCVLGSTVLLGAAAGLPALARDRAKRSGEIIAGVSERALILDPANHYSISTTSVLRHVFDPLAGVTHDSKCVSALAESWRAVNNTPWRFTLRTGVTFHDGSPFTADSVVFTLKRVRDNTKLIKSFVYRDIESVETDGDYAVSVTTKGLSAPSRLT